MAPQTLQTPQATQLSRAPGAPLRTDRAPHPPLRTDRAQLFARLAENQTYDLAIIGGGATGLGLALDAASRGYSVVLLDATDFAKGTSSRSTKLVHGGVRYLAQGNVSLVYEALHERTTLLHNAAHLAQPLAFVLPCYKFWELPFYGAGLILYDALSGKRSLGRTRFWGAQETLKHVPNLHTQSLKGSVKYWDGQFDDARLALALARTAAQRGALLINYCSALELTHSNGQITGLVAQDHDTQQTYQIKASCVVNAAGVWVDALRAQDDGAAGRTSTAMVAPSQGVHVVVDREFLAGEHAIIVPHTSDGRVLFAVPWLGKVIIGTTDTPRHDLNREPDPYSEELEFILRESARYLTRAPTREDIKSIWVGLRPLVKPPKDDDGNTKAISREHTVLISQSKMVTVTGGKWTTYRAMAQDVLKHCVDAKLLPERQACVTANLALVGAQTGRKVDHPMYEAPGLKAYGDEAEEVTQLPGAERHLGGGLTEAMVRFAVRHEYARTVEDVLARRSRLLFLDAKLAGSMAESVGEIIADEILAHDPDIEAFKALALHYLKLPG
ncbi:MAG: glycerol-3-phosphate dehydrogenase/oxidase [Alcaligenaceae bacterium]|nr:glycerol-3-phosphate dehydrogenase/oxidase [Alcaligenaceae bacterium]